MVIRTRLRSIATQISLWLLVAGAVAYFGYHGIHGRRGLEAHRNFETEIAELQAQLAEVQKERMALEAHINTFEPSGVDRDLLDEEARRLLGWLHPNDRVILIDD